jgi:hypothetical protein
MGDARRVQRGNVDEDILAAVFDCDKAETLRLVEPLDLALERRPVDGSGGVRRAGRGASENARRGRSTAPDESIDMTLATCGPFAPEPTITRIFAPATTVSCPAA